jgi:hypothetical protein
MTKIGKKAHKKFSNRFFIALAKNFCSFFQKNQIYAVSLPLQNAKNYVMAEIPPAYACQTNSKT